MLFGVQLKACDHSRYAGMLSKGRGGKHLQKREECREGDLFAVLEVSIAIVTFIYAQNFDIRHIEMSIVLIQVF